MPRTYTANVLNVVFTDIYMCSKFAHNPWYRWDRSRCNSLKLLLLDRALWTLAVYLCKRWRHDYSKLFLFQEFSEFRAVATSLGPTVVFTEMRSHPCTALLFGWYVFSPIYCPFFYLWMVRTYSHPCTAHLEKPGTTHAYSHTCTTSTKLVHI